MILNDGQIRKRGKVGWTLQLTFRCVHDVLLVDYFIVFETSGTRLVPYAYFVNISCAF